MTIFNLAEYISWKNAMLRSPHGERITSKRGEYIQLHAFVITDIVNPDFHLKNKRIENAEFSLILDGKIYDAETINYLYENDDELLAAYKRLRIRRFADCNKKSRNNVICEPKCCLAYWQINCDELSVVSRSLDMCRAGLSDVVVVNQAACLLGCKQFNITVVSPHIYMDKTKIARRA